MGSGKSQNDHIRFSRKYTFAMRRPTTLAALLCLIVAQAPSIFCSPLLSKEELQNDWDWVKHLFDRQAQCNGVYCGESSQYCCTAGSTCYTDAATIARCGAPTAAAELATGWQYFTTTIVLTNLVTVVSTYSSLVGGAASTQELAQSAAICNYNQVSCAAVCCDSGYTCYAPGKCTPAGAAPTTTSPSAPLRQTSGSTTTVTAIVSATTTEPFQTPVSTAGSSINGTSITPSTANNGLSGGAIAGIVIGVLASIVILLLLCLCCIFKATLDGVLSLFGLRSNKSRERTEIIEERYSRHGSATRRDEHGTWYGGGGGRSSRVQEKKKRSRLGEGGILAAIALGLAGLWAVLGLRRRSKAKSSRSNASYETYSESYSGTLSSESKYHPSPQFQPLSTENAEG